MALFVGVGGTTREQSSSEYALRITMQEIEAQGHETAIFAGSKLKELPIYDPDEQARSVFATEYVETLRSSDGLVVSTPGYHGTVSGLIKNALDYTEDLRTDERCYLDGLPVGCISVAYGWQAAVGALTALRDITHALRGWPTPYGAAINSAAVDVKTDTDTVESLRLVAQQVVWFVERT